MGTLKQISAILAVSTILGAGAANAQSSGSSTASIESGESSVESIGTPPWSSDTASGDSSYIELNGVGGNMNDSLGGVLSGDPTPFEELSTEGMDHNLSDNNMATTADYPSAMTWDAGDADMFEDIGNDEIYQLRSKTFQAKDPVGTINPSDEAFVGDTMSGVHGDSHHVNTDIVDMDNMDQAAGVVTAPQDIDMSTGPYYDGSYLSSDHNPNMGVMHKMDAVPEMPLISDVEGHADMPTVMPDMGHVDMPVDMPDMGHVDMPVDMPDMGHVDIPVDMPDMGHIDMPVDMSGMGHVDMPVDMPDMSHVDIPVDMPDMSHIDIPVDMPDMGHIDVQEIIPDDMPKDIETPK